MTEQERLLRDKDLRNWAAQRDSSEEDSIEYMIQRMAFKLNRPVEEIRDLEIIKARVREMLSNGNASEGETKDCSSQEDQK